MQRLALALLVLAAPVAAQAPRATIHRDAWGVPHVLSDTDEGALFGMAWALAEDDWPLIEENYLHALGRLAELHGERALQDDWMARALRIVPLSIREYERATPRMRDLLEAFAEGMNAWLAQQPREAVRVLARIEPWYPLALIRYKYYQNEFLGYAGLEDAWAERLFERAGGTTPPDAEPRYYEAQFDHMGQRPRGSNEWAVAPARTRDGHALLLINPHQSFVGVQRYAEIHVDSREGLRFSGLTVFGFLLPYMGHNGRLGWAYTDNYADHSDLYALTFDDASRPNAYRYGDGWREAEVWTDSIAVRTDRGLEWRGYEFRWSHYGPVAGIADDGRILAVRMARYEDGGWFAQWDAMIRARNLEEWRTAMARLDVA